MTRGTRERHHRRQAFREGRSDPFDALQVRKGTKWTPLLAIIDDAARKHRPDSWQDIQLLRRRNVDVY
jgi:hypothetical protein